MSKIEWTDATWNPVTGCEVVSPGCDRCYAAREAAGRLSSHPAYRGLTVRGEDGTPAFTGEIRVLEDRMLQPLRWRNKRMVFVNSMSDLFHRSMDDLTIARIFAVMSLASWHTFQVLTKRPKSMAALTADRDGELAYKVSLERRHIMNRRAQGSMEFEAVWPLPNVWLGTSIENNRYAWRANYLRESAAAVRFVSVEPMLGPVSELDLRGLDWCIVGGESGPGARQTDVGWVRELRDMCREQGVALFVKQLSTGHSRPTHELMDFPEDLRIREYPV
jgi:protein gp37